VCRVWESRQNRSFKQPVDHAIDAARDALDEMVDDPDCLTLIQDLYASAWPTLRRLALYAASQSPHAFSAIASPLPRNLAAELYNPRVYHELALLLRQPPAQPDQTFLAALQLAIAVGPSNQMEPERRLAWQQRWLRMVRIDLLSEDQQSAVGELPPWSEDEAARESFLIWSSGFFSPSAPVDEARFRELVGGLTIEHALAFVRTPESQGVTVTPLQDPEGLWAMLVSYATDTGQLALLLGVWAQDLERFGTQAIPAAAISLGAAQPDQWDQIFDWLDHVVAEGGAGAKTAVADGLRTTVPAIIPDLQMPRAIRLAERLLAETATPLTIPAERESDGRPHWPDLVMVQLNSPAGEAALSLVSALQRDQALAASESNRQLPDWLVTDAERATREEWGGVEFRLALGAAFPLITYAAPDFADRLLALVLPQSTIDPVLTARFAFWTGYFYPSEVFSQSLLLVANQFEYELQLVTQDCVLSEYLMERLCAHIAIGFIRRLEGYRALMQAVVDAQRPEFRAAMAEAFGHLLPDADDSGDLAERIRSAALWYWQQHAQRGSAHADENFDPYVLWLTYLKRSPLADLAQPLLVLAQSTSIKRGHDWIVQYLADHWREQPVQAFTIVRTLIARNPKDLWIRWSAEMLVPLIVQLGQGTPEISGELETLVNQLLASGAFSLADANTVLGRA